MIWVDDVDVDGLCDNKLEMGGMALTGDGTLGDVGDLDTHGRASDLGHGSHAGSEDTGSHCD